MLSKDPFNVRGESNSFLNELSKYDISEGDKNLLISIFRHISLYNVLIDLHNDLNHKNHVKGIVYDFLNSLVAVLNKRERYLQLNIRSLIEHIARIALNLSNAGNDFDGTVRRRNFDFLKQTKTNENWSYMHDTYINACHFVHSSPQARMNVSSRLLQLLDNDHSTSQTKLIRNLQKISSAVMRIFMSYFKEDISSIFFRSHADLKFLLGNSLFLEFNSP